MLKSKDMSQAKRFIVQLEGRLKEANTKIAQLELEKSILVEEMGEFRGREAEMHQCLTDISNMCVGEQAMSYRLDSQVIGEMIYKATGKTNPELNQHLDLVDPYLQTG